MPTVLGTTELFPAKLIDGGGQAHDITHPNYGAVHTAEVDNAPAIQLAIDAALADGTNTIVIAGEFGVATDVVFPPELRVISKNGRLVWNGAGAPAVAVVVCNADGASLAVNRLVVEGQLTIDADGHPVAFKASGLQSDCSLDLRVVNFSSFGVHIASSLADDSKGFQLAVEGQGLAGSTTLRVEDTVGAHISRVASSLYSGVTAMLRGLELYANVKGCVVADLFVEDANIPLSVGSSVAGANCDGNTVLNVRARHPNTAPASYTFGGVTGSLLATLNSDSTSGQNNVLNIFDEDGYSYAVVDAQNARSIVSAAGQLTPFFLSGALSAAQGGTGRSTLTLNALLSGNGVDAVNHVAVGANTTVLKSNGVSWAAGFTDWTELTGKPADFTPSAHTHTFASLTSKPTTLGGFGITDALTSAQIAATYSPLGHTHSYGSLTGIPATFAPSAHTHPWGEVTGKPTTLGGYGITDALTSAQIAAAYAPLSHTHAYSSLTGIPATFAPSEHTHTYSSLTGIPTTFAPSAHTHPYSDITGAPATAVGQGVYRTADISTTGSNTWVDVPFDTVSHQSGASMWTGGTGFVAPRAGPCTISFQVAYNISSNVRVQQNGVTIFEGFTNKSYSLDAVSVSGQPFEVQVLEPNGGTATVIGGTGQSYFHFTQF